MDSEGCFEGFGALGVEVVDILVDCRYFSTEVVDILVQIKVKCSKAYWFRLILYFVIL